VRVMVGKIAWSVYLVEDIDDAMRAAYGKTVKPLGKNVVGYTDTHNRIIFLKKKKSAQQLASTYLHELLHASCPEMSEKRVYHLERTLFKLLWKDGWRPSVLYR
jgi:hypothetical protein